MNNEKDISWPDGGMIASDPQNEPVPLLAQPEAALWEVKFYGKYPGFGLIKNVSFFFITKDKDTPPDVDLVTKYIHGIAKRDGVIPVEISTTKYVNTVAAV
jgi:hypothetical protein